jgi:hypothetical protein
VDKDRNDLSAAVPKLCLALEQFRRTPEGRVRTSQELLAVFFPHDESTCTDRVFKHLPNDVRGPIVAAWGIRGIKAALRDTDEKVQQVVHDALVAGDIDHAAFEDGLSPETLVRWVPLGDLWSFWRGGKLAKPAIHKALSTAYELYLFDARWFFETISAKGGSLKGTDVLADGLTKDELAQWVRRIHETGDGTPKGILAALGWDKIVARTSNEVLVAVLDAMAAKVGLVVAAARESSPRAAESTPKLDAKADAPPPAAAGLSAAPPAPAGAAPAANSGDDEPSPTDVGDRSADSWSFPPAAAAQEDAIQVVVDDEVLVAASPPTARRIVAAAPIPPADDDDTEVKVAPRSRSERPSVRGGPSRR